MKKCSGGKVSAPVDLLTARKNSGNVKKTAVRLGTPRKNKKQNTPFRSGTVPYMFDENGRLWILLVLRRAADAGSSRKEIWKRI